MFEAFKPLKYRILYIPRKLANFASHRIKVFARKQCALGTLYICLCSSLSLQLLQGLQDSALSIYCPYLHGTNYSVAGKVQDANVKGRNPREGRQEPEEARILMPKPTCARVNNPDTTLEVATLRMNALDCYSFCH